jgi:uncharacterized protein YcbX
MSGATISALWRHPVKSMQGERVKGGELGPSGLPFDRRWGVVDVASGKVLSAKREGKLLEAAARLAGDAVQVRLPDGDWMAAPDPALDKALSDWLGRPVRLEAAPAEGGASYQMNVDATDENSEIIDLPCPPGTFLDALPVHVLTTASLRSMQQKHPDGEWDVRRFRPTALIESDADGFPEDAWIGSAVRMGEAQLMVVAPTVRCVMTTRAQPGLDRDLDIVKSVNREHECNLGVYAVVTQPGRVAAGDTVEPA